MDYEALVRARATGPLKMEKHADRTDAGDEGAAGEGAHGTPACGERDSPVFAGAGVLRSDARHMSTFLGAHLGVCGIAAGGGDGVDDEGAAPGDAKHGDRAGVDRAEHGGARDLLAQRRDGAGVSLLHGVRRETRVGVVVLSNMLTNFGVDDIGPHLLNPSVPVAKLLCSRCTRRSAHAGGAGKVCGCLSSSPPL